MRHERDYGPISAWLSGCHRPLLVSHQRSDGDAIGALAAMSLVLARRGAEPAVALFDRFPYRYAVLRDAVTWLDWADARDVLTRDCDALVVLDTCSFSQLEPIGEFLARAPQTLVIDHHATRDAIAVREGDLRHVDETASATCLILAEWVHADEIAFDEPLATALLTGIATDCGWFRYSNTDARTLAMAAELVAAGVDANQLYRAIYEQEPLAKLRLAARVLDSLQVHAGGRLVVMTLRQADFAAAGADSTMTEDLVNEAGRLSGSVATILFTEEPDGRVRVNFRSKHALDVSVLAARFGGGGHPRAAGARMHGQWEQVLRTVIGETVEALGPG